MLGENEIVSVLTAALMDTLPRGVVVRVPKADVQGNPAEERRCVQIDATDEEFYTLKVVNLTAAQRRAFGVTEESLKEQLPDDLIVRYTHVRRVVAGGDVYLPKHVALRNGLEVAPRGGTTLAYIEHAGGRSWHGEAICSDADNFCRASGRLLALDRAVRAYNADQF